MSQNADFKFVCIFLAGVFLSFQLEIFEEEYKANHPARAEECAINKISLNWESFDKENAQKAFTIGTRISIEFLFKLPAAVSPLPVYYRPFHPVRDKSPPAI